ncbi:MAG TPA: DpnII family type II restriction endonuclease [Chitinophagales bacterium]|nr:DpnII family type II restriction endonuclease [Chitinophagales bacterium]
MKTNEIKFRTVIDKNTFYFYNPIFQEKYESYINTLNATLLSLKNQIETQGLRRSIFEELLAEKEHGLRALLALTGFANESLKRLITIVRVADNEELSKLLLTQHWLTEKDKVVVSEWGDSRINSLIRTNVFFRKGIVNLFFEGASVPFLATTLPLFELKKLSISKLNFEIPALIDTLVRYKEKGSYAGKGENNPEYLLAGILDEMGICFQKGDLTELFINEPVAKRTMDFIIPNKQTPKIIIESSFVMTTSSGQGDKSKTEGTIKRLIEKYYPQAKFIGFVDGIGWYVRKSDLMRMVNAFDDVFTFEKTEIERFKQFLKQNL